MVDFKGERLSFDQRIKEMHRLMADHRRMATETLLALLEHKLNNGETVEEVFAIGRKALKTLYEFEMRDLEDDDDKHS